jgi:spore coat polysaccharide biosynthesis protein SpsF
MKIVAIIEARMNSSRLPGKHMLSVLDRPIITYLFERLKKSVLIDDIVLATTTNIKDDVLVDLASRNDIHVFRGSEDDVLGRVYAAAKKSGADTIVEISGDCPLIDWEIMDQTISLYEINNCDFVTNATIGSFPGGMDISVFSFESLESSHLNGLTEYNREHVATYMVDNPDKFTRLNLPAPPELNRPDIEFIMDEHKDYLFLKEIIELTYKKPFPPKCFDLIKAYDQQKGVQLINSSVARNNITSKHVI